MYLLLISALGCFIASGVLAMVCIKNFIDLEKANRQSKRDAATIARLKRLLKGGEVDGT